MGPTNKVNLIIVGFNSTDASLGDWQQAKWLGGKKNDLVVCYGDGWVKCFGWTESEIVKRNLETLFLANPINESILPLAEIEIRQNYKLKDWKKFDYISITPKTGYIVTYVILLIVMQVAVYITSMNIGDDYDDDKYRKKYTHALNSARELNKFFGEKYK